MKKLFLVFFFISLNVHADERLSPVDESSDDPTFVTFKKNLNEAILKHNSAFIKNILADDVQYTFGADPNRQSAIDGFMKHYNIEKSSKFWNDLRSVIELGCTKSKDSFLCPYVYSKWPSQFDSFSYIVTIKEKTPIRVKPQRLAKTMRNAEFEILKLASNQKAKGWYEVDLGDRKIGFVSQSDARSPIGYRAEFHKTLSSWKLKYFIAGD